MVEGWGQAKAKQKCTHHRVWSHLAAPWGAMGTAGQNLHLSRAVPQPFSPDPITQPGQAQRHEDPWGSSRVLQAGSQILKKGCVLGSNSQTWPPATVQYEVLATGKK